MTADSTAPQAGPAGWLGSSVPSLSPLYRAGAIGVGGAFGAAALVRFGLDPRGLIGVVFVVGLTAIAAIDLEHRVIPNRIVIPLTAFVLAAQCAFFFDRTVEWLAAGAGAALLLLIPAYIRPGSVGMGDVKLASLIGVGLGREVVTALFLGSLAAVPVALWILARRGLDARKDTIPLGPFLAGGGMLALFVGGSL
ncbi:MAG: prepilin peptidase [Solirubrobacterales bacterium]|nr:prepilin peptidase [Solirubrobacterales bacterium]